MNDKGLQFDTIIVGLGKTGLSCVRFLADKGIKLAVVDSRKSPPELEALIQSFADIPVYTGKFDVELLSSVSSLVVSPGVSISEPAIQHAIRAGVEVIGDIELFARYAENPIIAVTGSNGKSTVSTLVTEMLRAAGVNALLGGNIGTPALSLLEEPAPGFYVLELSSFQLETVYSLNAAVSVVLNISTDHMDRYNSMDDYIQAKQKIFMGDGTMIINRDDPIVSAMVEQGRSIIAYSLQEPSEGEFGLKLIGDNEYIFYGTESLLPVSELGIKGRHNTANALAALALGKAAGLAFPPMLDALKNFRGLPHRCEWVATVNDIDWINDSKGTNPGASCAAIEGLAEGNNIVLIAGGDGKGADFSGLARSALGRVHTAILIGRDANRIAAVLDSSITVCHATSMDAAVSVGARLAKPGDRVLLSPACASLDMFTNYQERGQVFSEAVLRLNKRARPDV